MAFRKATRTESRARVVITGPSGSGKTRTALEFARVLGRRVAVIDTERGSASRYGDRFDFDVDELVTFAPLAYVASIREAEAAGYDVIVIDSLSHAWTGRGGGFAAGRAATPTHDALVDAMTGSPAHVIATMRSRTEYVIEEDARGSKVPRRVGTAQVQREGMEYEFDLAIEMDPDHRGVVTKSRCDALADGAMARPGSAWAVTALDAPPSEGLPGGAHQAAEPWMTGEASIRAYLAQRAHWNALENAVRKHDAGVPGGLHARWRQLAARGLQALSVGQMAEALPLDGDHGCHALGAKWAGEGPRRAAARTAGGR